MHLLQIDCEVPAFLFGVSIVVDLSLVVTAELVPLLKHDVGVTTLDSIVAGLEATIHCIAEFPNAR